MKNLSNYLVALVCVLLIGLVVFSCAKDEEVKPAWPEELYVYKLIDGERVLSTKYRLPTESEIQKMIDLGWLSEESQIGVRVLNCKWADYADSFECNSGATKCGVISAPNGQVCIGCLDDNGNLYNLDQCRDAT